MAATRTWFCVLAGLALVMTFGTSVAEARKIAEPPPRFKFNIDPKTPLKDLLPTPPLLPDPQAPWLVKDLTQVPEIFFQMVPVLPAGPKDVLETRKLSHGRMEEAAHVIVKINHLNLKGTDHFLKVLLEHRPDLAGLPFVMGDACRQSKAVSRQFVKEVAMVRQAMQDREATADQFWKRYEKRYDLEGKNAEQIIGPLAVTARLAALTQMLAPEPAVTQKGLIEHLCGVHHKDTSSALTRLAVFSCDQEVREAALNALEQRQGQENADLLLEGLRYPWPAVAKHAGAAIVKLERKDLVPKLVDFLDEPDPRSPREAQVNGRKTVQLRELVRLNHHHNCLTCHAPANTPDVKLSAFGSTEDMAVGAVSIPGEVIAPPSRGYFFSSPDILVRADVTYLRQDFSLMQKVPNTAPWPEMQRFDFLVRTREVTEKDMQAYRQWVKQQGPDYLSPNHQAALTALRQLTGRDAPPNAQAWRRVLSPK